MPPLLVVLGLLSLLASAFQDVVIFSQAFPTPTSAFQTICRSQCAFQNTFISICCRHCGKHYLANDSANGYPGLQYGFKETGFQSKDELEDDWLKGRAEEWAKDFVDSIMSKDYEPIPDSNGMQVLRDVADMELGEVGDIILRNITEKFWQACIDQVDTPHKRYRVAAVGTPGVGKTTSTPVLIRMLLKAKKTVVCLVRTTEKTGWYYEFTPRADGSVTATVYPEKVGYVGIASLYERSTYFVVDPGQTKDDCNPPGDFQAKFILVTSTDWGHWGGNEFTKRRGGVMGFFKYFPVWMLEELLAAQPFLGPGLAEDEVKDRFRQVGGVPRVVFAEASEFRVFVGQNQKSGLSALSVEQVKRIVRGTTDDVEDMSPNQPRSSVLGYRLAPDDDGTFSHKETVLISSLVEEKVSSLYMKDLWGLMMSLGDGGWKIFEVYTRTLLASTKSVKLQGRRCVGKGRDAEGRKVYNHIESVELGGCKEICLAVDVVDAARNEPNVLFHSVNRQNELIDFVYCDEAGHFHAFQVTIGKDHDAEATKITKLEEKAGGSDKVSLYYLVPGDNFPTYVTNPVDPRTTGASCNLWHVLIPNPKETLENEADP